MDEIQIWIGGPTLKTSTLLRRLSGDVDTTSLGTIYSTNHFMILVYRSDKTVEGTGFKADFNSGIVILPLTEMIFTDYFRPVHPPVQNTVVLAMVFQ